MPPKKSDEAVAEEVAVPVEAEVAPTEAVTEEPSGEPVEPEAAVVEEPADEAPAAEEGDEAVAEEVVPERDPEIAALGASEIRMFHPDGGTCDAYPSTEIGDVTVLSVPADDAATMIEHGFVLFTEA